MHVSVNERRPGIDRVISLLEAVARNRAPMGIGEIARRINAPRSTTYGIVNRLLEARLLEPSGSEGQVYLGIAMHVFGRAYNDHSARYRRISDALDRLSAETSETVQLCGLRRDKYAVLDARDAPAAFRISTDIGQEVPIPWTASGRLLLSHLSADEVCEFVPSEDYRLPDGRTIDVADFLADIETAREAGYCESSGLIDRMTWCMAAPVYDERGIVTSTMCAVVAIDTDETRKAALLERIREEAALLSSRQG